MKRHYCKYCDSYKIKTDFPLTTGGELKVKCRVCVKASIGKIDAHTALELKAEAKHQAKLEEANKYKTNLATPELIKKRRDWQERLDLLAIEKDFDYDF